MKTEKKLLDRCQIHQLLKQIIWKLNNKWRINYLQDLNEENYIEIISIHIQNLFEAP